MLNAARHEGLRAFMVRVYGYMAWGLALTGAVAYAGAASGFYERIAGTMFIWIVILAPLGFVFALSFGAGRLSAAMAQVLFWLFAASTGLSLAGVFLLFTGISIARVFFITGATFAAMSLYGYTTRSDLTRMGSFLMMGLIGIVIASLVNLFIGSTALQFAISAIGVIVFVGLTAYDTQRIKAIYLEEDAEEVADKKADPRRARALSRFHQPLHCDLKGFRRIATRYDKTDASYAAAIHLAACRLALR